MKSAVVMTFVLAAFTGISGAQDILITELLARRSTSVLDDDGSPSDFIEIYNAGTSAVELGGYFLGDDCNNRFKWSFPEGVTVEPGEFLVVWASENDRRDPCCDLHTNFRLDPDGSDCLVLSNPAGEQIHVYQFYPEQVLGYSYGLAMANGIERDSRHYFPTPTPGTENVVGAPGVSETPVFSEQSGAYSPGLLIDIAMAVPVEGTEIRFTTSASLPTESSPIYTEPIAVLSEVVITARAFQPGLLPGEPVTHHYLVLDEGMFDFDSTIPLVVCSSLDRTIRPAPGGCGRGGYTPGRFLIFAPDANGVARFTDAPLLAHRVGYRKRGNPDFSCGRAKFFFNMEFRDREDKDEDVAFLDFSPHADFAMWGPYEFDRSYMRNPIAFWMSRAIGRWAPRTQFVECFLRNPGVGKLSMENYWGVYVLMERNERGAGRIDVERLEPGDNQEPDVTGGYILKRDRIEPHDVGLSAGGHTNIVFAYPRVPTAAQKSYIRDYLDTMFDSLSPDIGSQEDSDLIDVVSFIDHHILNWYMKNTDAFRLSGYFFKSRGGPLEMGGLWDLDRSSGCAIDPRPANPEGYLCEPAWDGGTRYFDYPGPPVGNDGGTNGSWYGRLFDNEPPTGGSPWAHAYRKRWQELRNGPLRTEAILGQLDAWSLVLTEPAQRNSARWSEVPPRGGHAGEVKILKNWLAERATWIDRQFIDRPELKPPPGGVKSGTRVEIFLESGETFYTLNGPDPLGPDQQPVKEAIAYTGPISITENTRVRARARTEGIWSGLVEGFYLTDVTTLVVSEIQFNPVSLPDDSFNSSVYQFLEFYNPGSETIDLRGVVLDRPHFEFEDGTITSLEPGGYLVVARNLKAFEERYGSEGIPIAGNFFGGLQLNGQNIFVEGAAGETLMDFDYQDNWYASANGEGHSLVIRNPEAPASTWRRRSSWRSSLEIGGSPGREDIRIQDLRLHGDLDGNGQLDITDAIRLLLDLFGQPAQPCATEEGNLALQDTDGDGALTQNDALRLLKYFFLGEAPPQRGVECTEFPGCARACAEGV